MKPTTESEVLVLPASLADTDAGALRVRLSLLPLAGTMYITGNMSCIEAVSIYDLRGIRRVSLHHLQPGQAIDVSHLGSGLYYVVVETERGCYRAKVLF